MKQFKQYMFTSLGILSLLVAISISGLGSAAASAVRASVQKVFISGGSVKVSGSVNVGNTPNVNVGNTPNVNVSNAPNVNVANSPTVKIDPSQNSVQVSPGAPGQPVTFSGTVSYLTGAPLGTDKTVVAYTVPAGRVLVITFVSAVLNQQASDEFADAAFSIDTGPLFYIPLQDENGRGTGFDFQHVGSEDTSIYAGAGRTIVLHAPTEGGLLETPVSVEASFSGYLVNG
jgi:hypothetical protein